MGYVNITPSEVALDEGESRLIADALERAGGRASARGGAVATLRTRASTLECKICRLKIDKYGIGPARVGRSEFGNDPMAPRPCWTEADPARLDQVFSNLLTNAIKYTSAGGRVWATVRQHDDRAVVTIGDTGRGIAPENLRRVLEPFTTASSEEGGGLGIGLAVARHLVALHSGSISVASRGRGTEVTVTLKVTTSRTGFPNSRAGQLERMSRCRHQ